MINDFEEKTDDVIRFYAIDAKLDDRVIVDINSVDRVDFMGNLHLYMMSFPKLRIVVYTYLKSMQDGETILLSELHKKISGLLTGESYLHTEEHKHYMETDSAYKRAIDREVHRFHGMYFKGQAELSSFFFDSKYLLLPQQTFAQEFTSSSSHHATHPVGTVIGTRGSNAHHIQDFFEAKAALEKEYFDDILATFKQEKPDKLHVYAYANYIEIYDTVSLLGMKITLHKDNFHEYSALFPAIKNGKTKKIAFDLGVNFICKNFSLAQLIGQKLLTAEGRIKTNAYIDKMNALITNPTGLMVTQAVETIIDDMRDNNQTLFWKLPRLRAIFLHRDLLEDNTINVCKGTKHIRITRRPEWAGKKDIVLQSFLMKGESFDIAKELVLRDLINIVDTRFYHDFTEYRMLLRGDTTYPRVKIFLTMPLGTVYTEYASKYASKQHGMIYEAKKAIKDKYQFEDRRYLPDDIWGSRNHFMFNTRVEELKQGIVFTDHYKTRSFAYACTVKQANILRTMDKIKTAPISAVNVLPPMKHIPRSYEMGYTFEL